MDSPSLDEVREYYRILVDLYRNKVKTPLFPFDFLRNYTNRIGEGFY